MQINNIRPDDALVGNGDLMGVVGRFLTPDEVLTVRNSNITGWYQDGLPKHEMDVYGKQRFLECFGVNEHVQNGVDFNAKNLMTLVGYSELLDEYPKWYTLKIPFKGWKLWWERMKWLSGVDNEIDKKISEIYEKHITSLKHLLKETKPTSIMQITNHMKGTANLLKHATAFEKAYVGLRKKESKGFINRLCRFCLQLFFSIFYKKCSEPKFDIASFNSVQNSAQIGQFQLDDTRYVVEAKYDLRRGNCNYYFGLDHSDLIQIGIQKKQYEKDSLSLKDTSFKCEISQVGSGKLEISIPSISDSNRDLFQRLIRIMMEVAKQNEGIRTISISSSTPSKAVEMLEALGFQKVLKVKSKSDGDSSGSDSDDRVRARSKLPRFQRPSMRLSRIPHVRPSDFAGNPVQDSFEREFNLSQSSTRNICSSEGYLESWDDILKRDPVLNPHAAEITKFGGIAYSVFRWEYLKDNETSY